MLELTVVTLSLDGTVGLAILLTCTPPGDEFRVTSAASLTFLALVLAGMVRVGVACRAEGGRDPGVVTGVGVACRTDLLATSSVGGVATTGVTVTAPEAVTAWSEVEVRRLLTEAVVAEVTGEVELLRDLALPRALK